jgi:hypothetical protein
MQILAHNDCIAIIFIGSFGSLSRLVAVLHSAGLPALSIYGAHISSSDSIHALYMLRANHSC